MVSPYKFSENLEKELTENDEKDIPSQALGDRRSFAPFFAVRSIRLLLHDKAVIFTGQERTVPA